MSPPNPSDELLSAYLDGEVSVEERAAVDDALARSSERRAALAGLAETRDAVRALADLELPSGFLDGVEQAVARSDAVRTAPVPRERAARRGLAWLAGGVAAAALVAALVVPATDRVDPALPARVNAHAARASVSDDPVSELAPVAAATGRISR